MTAAGSGARSLVVVVPGDINTRTGGYGYDREIIDGLGRLEWDVSVCALDRSFPFPSDDARRRAVRELAALPDGALVLADGLAFGALADEAHREAARLRFVALVHHPLARETGLDPETAERLFVSERRALGAARGVVVTSTATVESLRPYDVPSDRIAIVPPGTTPAPAARGTRGIRPPRSSLPVELLAVASLTPRKGYDVLFQALTRLQHLPWHLTCAGTAELHSPTAEALVRQVRESGLTGRVTFAGELTDEPLARVYDRADVFVLPTRYEGYGMAVAEAVARGIPVIATPTGAIPDLVDGASGVIVPIDDVEALAGALERVMNDETRAGMADGAERRRATLPTWEDAARSMAAALTGFSVDGIVLG